MLDNQTPACVPKKAPEPTKEQYTKPTGVDPEAIQKASGFHLEANQSQQPQPPLGAYSLAAAPDRVRAACLLQHAVCRLACNGREQQGHSQHNTPYNTASVKLTHTLRPAARAQTLANACRPPACCTPQQCTLGQAHLHTSSNTPTPALTRATSNVDSIPKPTDGLGPRHTA
jgi:hypothetical protein